jgi:hypothetical protein
MEGGIGILLLLIVLVLVVVGGIALYLTGGGILASQGRAGDGDGKRPRHKHPADDDPVQQHTHFVGTPEGDEAMRNRR